MAAKQLTFLSLWAINDSLDGVSLKRQLEELQSLGIEGVIFHPRYYPGVPRYMSSEYLAIVSEVILHAKQIGMSFWLYDENGWPSGTAGGQVIERNPELKCEWLEWTQAGGTAEASDDNRLAIYEGGIGEVSHEVKLAFKHAVSSLDPNATACFLELTYDGYRKGLDPEAFDYVTGFFSDEVAFLDGHGITFHKGGVPWCDRLPKEYEARYGETLYPLLPLLFIDGERAPELRSRYWELLTDALIEGFYEPIAAWCSQYGKLFTAHLKAEENPFFQLSYSGSGFQVLKGLTMPALDALERYPGNHFYPRMVHSISVQQGREGTHVEAMGGAGWGASPESFVNYALWLASHGVDTFTMHLNQYQLSMHALHDWPPSLPCHMSWKDSFPSVLRHIKQEAAKLPDLRSSEPELLIVTPTRGVMGAFLPHEACLMNEHDGSGIPDTRAGLISNHFIEMVDRIYATGIHYELTEERVVEESAVIAEGKVRIGRRVYHKVLLGNGCLWNVDGAGKDAVDRMREAGVELMLSEEEAAASILSCREPVVNLATLDALGVDLATLSRSKPSGISQSEWRVEGPQENQLLIELQPAGEGKRTAEFVVESPLGALTLILLDPPMRVAVNGYELCGEAGCLHYAIPAEAWAHGGAQQLKLEFAGPREPNEVAFLQGDFAVHSRSPYIEKDERQYATEGPFFVTAPTPLQGANLVSEGLPFCGQPVLARKMIEVFNEMPTAALSLQGIKADAVQLFLNGEELGWCWGPDFHLRLHGGVSAGMHELSAVVVPSTFNSYGPHRHYEGDRYLTSPMQYSGERNFADRADAPEQTLGTKWHFVKWEVGGEVCLHVE